MNNETGNSQEWLIFEVKELEIEVKLKILCFDPKGDTTREIITAAIGVDLIQKLIPNVM